MRKTLSKLKHHSQPLSSSITLTPPNPESIKTRYQEDTSWKDDIEEIVQPLPKQLMYNIIETTINCHGGRALLDQKPSGLYDMYCNVPLFKEMLLPALKYGCTLLLPHTISPSIEFYLTHLIRRHPASQRGITLNGNYLRITDKVDIYFQPHNSKTYPWKMCIDPFKQFPFNMNINLPSEIICEEDSYSLGIEDTVSIIGNGIIVTPLGDLPVLKISRPFNIEGCTWGIKFDDLNGLKWNNMRIIKYKEDKLNLDIKDWMYYTVYEDKSLQFAEELEENKLFNDIKNYIQLVVENLSGMVNNKSIEEQGILIKKVINGIMNKLPKEYQKQMNLDHMRRTFEGIITHQIFYDIWPPLIEKTTEIIQNSCEKDRDLDWRILALQFIQLKDLEINFLDCPLGKYGIEITIQQLRRINSYKSPHQKAVILITSLKFLQLIIYKTLPKGGPVSADVFFPSLVYVLIKANIPFFASNIDYIKAFMNKPFDEQTYYITSIESVFCLIENFQASNIGWKETDFIEALNISKMHPNPFDFTTTNILRPSREIQVPPFERIKKSCEIIGRSKNQLLNAFKEVIEENKRLKTEIINLQFN
ncbi:vacuolar sorting protein 9 (VPS9) domain containing protein [Entamoeba nuttalli P19]|uniref:Vacuolar sorting protein 9 (VPS9) domain containing protein n=1 Tax=Entamoeba nuttalli (strain P19) TaxID=1076696 RepID=K2HBF7_ENTNP|nr:vacuolar sorting protein 9 (VPS9) domain containing protein [Entamoeba nuttalli P19]EKE39999.1 vacuolar sorting protein 9 (VPS9) domain containing protein [Entamoeba nuttalli P19]|eukprot:XP_008857669.1 vacuolar sorting protein 9 (VPS9) domain containing protein [Entamoeba nuttalli P19]